MSLRQKTILLTILILLGLLLILLALSAAIWFDSAARLEQRDLQQALSRVIMALTDELAELDRFNADWAAWDDTYAFIVDHNPSYINTNLTAETLIHGKLSAILFVDLSGQVIYSKTMDLDRQVEQPTSMEWAAYLPALTKLPTLQSRINGVVSLDHESFLVTACPILTSKNQEPIHGTLIMGRELKREQIQDLEQVTGLTFTIRNLPDPALPADFKQAYRVLHVTNDPDYRSAPSVYTLPLNEDLAAAYTLLLDVKGEPALLLRVEMPRLAYQNAQASTRTLVLYLVLLALIAIALSIPLLDHFVLRRLAQLESGVRHITESGDLTARMPVTAHDELSSLARSINSMLAALEHAQEENTRLLEDLRTANERLKELDRLKTQFVANMSHELRTPLNAILGFSELLSDEVPGRLNGEQHNYVQHIETSGRHLQALINDILDLSKLQANRIELDRRFTDLSDVVTAAQTFVWPMVQRKRQRIEVELAPDLPGLYIDPLRIKQVLINLLSNATKFTPPGGRIAVYAAVWREVWLRVSISDTGPGIPPSEQTEVFEEFAQLNWVQPDSEQGSGLGLAIARKLVSLHNGNIWIESSGVPGEGTTFHFTLPTADHTAGQRQTITETQRAARAP